MSFGMSDTLTGLTHYAGASKSLFDVIYDVFYDTILPLNGLLICLFVISRWKMINFKKELDEGLEKGKHGFLLRYSEIALKTYIPVILALVFLNTVAMKFFGYKLLF